MSMDIVVDEYGNEYVLEPVEKYVDTQIDVIEKHYADDWSTASERLYDRIEKLDAKKYQRDAYKAQVANAKPTMKYRVARAKADAKHYGGKAANKAVAGAKRTGWRAAGGAISAGEHVARNKGKYGAGAGAAAAIGAGYALGRRRSKKKDGDE